MVVSQLSSSNIRRLFLKLENLILLLLVVFKFFYGLLVNFSANYPATLFTSMACYGFGSLFLLELLHSVHLEIIVALDGPITNLSQSCENIWLGEKSLQSAISCLFGGSWDILLHLVLLRLNVRLRLIRHLLYLFCKVVSSLTVLAAR